MNASGSVSGGALTRRIAVLVVAVAGVLAGDPAYAETDVIKEGSATLFRKSSDSDGRLYLTASTLEFEPDDESENVREVQLAKVRSVDVVTFPGMRFLLVRYVGKKGDAAMTLRLKNPTAWHSAITAVLAGKKATPGGAKEEGDEGKGARKKKKGREEDEPG